MAGSIDTRRLRQFVTVAHLRSIGKAADQLGMTQPTLTRNLRSLETDVGARLFERSPTGTVLTRAGERLLPRAEEILNGVERALQEIDEEGAQGFLKVGISPSFHFDILPEAIARIVRDEPLLNITLIAGTRERIAEDLRSHEVDLGLCLIPTFFYTESREMAEISFEPVGEEMVRPYLRPDHPHVRVTDLQQTTGVRWAVPHQLSVSYRFESAFYRSRLPVPPQSLNSTSLTLLRNAATDAGMVSLLPERYARADVAAGRLATLPVPELHFDFLYGFLERKISGSGPQAETLKAVVREIAGRG